MRKYIFPLNRNWCDLQWKKQIKVRFLLPKVDTANSLPFVATLDLLANNGFSKGLKFQHPWIYNDFMVISHAPCVKLHSENKLQFSEFIIKIFFCYNREILAKNWFALNVLLPEMHQNICMTCGMIIMIQFIQIM